MNTNERPRREQPERNRPHRQFSNIMDQQSGSTDDEHTDSGQGANANWSDTVNYSVKMGYRVIEEQIRQGQRIAQQVNEGSYGVGAMNNDAQELAQSIQRYCEDSAQLYLRLMESMTADMSGRASSNSDSGSNGSSAMGGLPLGGLPLSGLMDTFLGNLSKFTTAENFTSSGNNQQASANHSHSDQVSVSLSVNSTQPVDISINIQTHANTLEVDRLHEKDATIAPVTGINFENSAEYPLKISVTIADDQPHGHYSGIIYDAESRRHCGTMSIQIGASPSDSD